MNKINKTHHCDWLENDLSDKVGKLIIADPPYFETKGEFDFIWKSFDHYLKDVEKWVLECKRVLADNGTLFWYGPAKKIAYTQVIMDEHFNLINNLVWNKGCFMGLEESNELKSFAPCTERILMYGSKEHDSTGLKTIEKDYVAPRNPFAIELRKARKRKRVSINQVAEYGKFYGNVNHGGAVTNWERGYNIPLQEQWEKICEYLPIEEKDYNSLRNEYENIRKEYEYLRRHFSNEFNLQEILNFSNEAVKTGSKYDHDTVKPEKLTRVLILTCSKKDDLVVVPFSGSGTECAMAAKEGRPFVGFEINEKDVNKGNKRCVNIMSQPQLF